MTISIMKTKAEQSLSAEFEAAEERLAGTGWVKTLRRTAIEAFNAGGLPHRRIEAWKYTDLRERIREAPPMAPVPARAPDMAEIDAALGSLAALDTHRVVLIDGHYSAPHSASELGSGIELKPLSPVLAAAPKSLREKFSRARVGAESTVTALNLAFMTDGILLTVGAGCSPSKPVLLINIRTSVAAGSISVRNIVAVEAEGGLTLIEAHVALGGAAKAQGNFATDLDIADHAAVTHFQVVPDGAGATHLSRWRTRIGEAATYRGFQLTVGASLARNELDIGFTGPNAKLDLSGAMLGRGSDHIDTTLVVNHSTPGCESRELFKCVLDDRARAVFQGKIIVAPQAQKTDGKQMSQALMLSEEAEFDSKPELEIYADDVACGHGATAAEIDPQMLFYLRSRGIPKDEARAMLIESFVGEAIEKVEDDSIRAALMEIAIGWLRQSPAKQSTAKR